MKYELQIATVFFNSFLMEWPYEVKSSGIHIALEKDVLILPLKSLSLTGRHQYLLPLIMKKGDKLSEISFKEAAQELVRFLSKRISLSMEASQEFLDRLENSVSNISYNIECRFNDLKNLSPDHFNFTQMEQLLFLGHDLHPLSKSRKGISQEDALKFSPELQGQFSLHWVYVKKNLLGQKSAQSFTDESWLRNLFQKEFPENSIPQGFEAFPLHPWQKVVLFQDSSFSGYLKRGDILDVGSASATWFPTSSMRTVYRQDAAYMLKFSLKLKLTNSVRTQLPHELDRGLNLFDVKEHTEFKKFLSSFPEFELVHEPVYAGILDNDGKILPDSLVLGRINTFENQDMVSLVAALTMEELEDQTGMLGQMIQKLSNKENISRQEASRIWFGEFFNVALKPLITLGSNLGVLLGAHQQNMLLKFSNYLPVKSYFRDCNGTGFTEEGEAIFKMPGIILPKEPASYLFGYYIFINTAFSIISALAHHGNSSEENLLGLLRDKLIELKDEVNGSFLLDYLLDEEYLMHKGNFFCSLKGINENTENDPLSIYTKIKNPLYQGTSL